MIWVVGIETTAPDQSRRYHNELSECLRMLRDREPTGSVDADGWMIQISVTTGTSLEALTTARNLIADAARNAGLPYWPERRISIVNSLLWFQRRAWRPESACPPANPG